jgi:hypothetical protein
MIRQPLRCLITSHGQNAGHEEKKIFDVDVDVAISHEEAKPQERLYTRYGWLRETGLLRNERNHPFSSLSTITCLYRAFCDRGCLLFLKALLTAGLSFSGVVCSRAPPSYENALRGMLCTVQCIAMWRVYMRAGFLHVTRQPCESHLNKNVYGVSCALKYWHAFRGRTLRFWSHGLASSCKAVYVNKSKTKS